jgi:hypothetical protein
VKDEKMDEARPTMFGLSRSHRYRFTRQNLMIAAIDFGWRTTREVG